MTDQEIRNVLTVQLIARRNCQPEELPPDGVIDSLEGVELLMAAEEIWEISISDESITSEACSDIDRLVEIIRLAMHAGRP